MTVKSSRYPFDPKLLYYQIIMAYARGLLKHTIAELKNFAGLSAVRPGQKTRNAVRERIWRSQFIICLILSIFMQLLNPYTISDNSRFWVDINDQDANCWGTVNSSGASRGRNYRQPCSVQCCTTNYSV